MVGHEIAFMMPERLGKVAVRQSINGPRSAHCAVLLLYRCL